MFYFGLNANSKCICGVNINNTTNVFPHSSGSLAVGSQKVKYIHIISKRYYITGYCVQYQYHIYIPYVCMYGIYLTEACVMH